jgi:hypothetical protein
MSSRAAGEIMSQPFVVKEDGNIAISKAELSKQFVVNAKYVSLADRALKAQGEKADLIERRLQRLEEALGLEAICAH